MGSISEFTKPQVLRQQQRSHRLAILGVFMFTDLAAAQTIWQVDDNACPGPGTGALADPFCRIQEAITAAVNGDTILVAPGTYPEAIVFSRKAIIVESTDGPVATTIAGDAASFAAVRFSSGEPPETMLRGFTIAGPNQGIYCSNSSPTIENCIVTGHSAENGAGIEITGPRPSSPTIRNCTIANNTATGIGGGIRCANNGPVLIENCTIEWTNGAGVYVAAPATITIRDSVIRNNSRSGIVLNDVTEGRVMGCQISGNRGDSGGGVALVGQRGFPPILERCVISGNQARTGGGIDCYDSSPLINDCTIEKNIASEYGGGLYVGTFSNPIIERCTITDNLSGQGGGIRIETLSDPTIRDTQITRNRAEVGGGASVRRGSSPTFEDSTIAANVASGVGGGINAFDRGQTRLLRCLVRENTALRRAGISLGDTDAIIEASVISENAGTPVYCNDASVQIVSTQIVRNVGGVVAENESRATFLHCTVADNITRSGEGERGLVALTRSQAFVMNSIFRSTSSVAIFLDGLSSTVATCSNIQGGWPGEGNVSDDPLFIGDGDYRLLPGSPSIHACPVINFGKGLATDLDGRARESCDLSDRGAYEFGPGDYNCDRHIDLFDMDGLISCMTGPADYYKDGACLAHDADSNGSIDLTDFAEFQNTIRVE